MKRIATDLAFLAILIFAAIITLPFTRPSAEAQVSSSPMYVDISARQAGQTAILCVTNAAGGSTVSNLGGRRALELQNLGPNAIYCTVDGQAPINTGALGRRIDAAGTWSLDVGPAVVVKCRAATAAQTTPACTQVTQLR